MSVLEKIIKKNIPDTEYIISVSNGDYITRILSEQILSYEFVNWNSFQSLNEFADFIKPNINYAPNDFLMKVNIEVLDELKKNQRIEFYKVDSYGWYYKKTHRAEIKLFNTAHPNKLNNLKELNLNIQAISFDQFRSNYRPLMVTNILNGAMGLSYHCFKEDYDELFRKIYWRDDEWILKTDNLKSFDRQILIQLLLYQHNRKKELINTITNGSDALSLYAEVLINAQDYFIHEDYSMKNFLQYIAAKIERPETATFVEEIKQIEERYVTKGLSVSPKITHSKFIKEFIDLAKSDTAELKELLESEEFKRQKSSIFLLGMLHLGDRLDEQFNFDNFIPSILSLTMRHIIDIKRENDNIHITFDITEIEKNRNNKFTYVKEYFNELRLLKELADDIQKLKEQTKKKTSKVKSSSDKKNKELTMSMFDGKSKEKDIINKPIKTTHSKPKKATKILGTRSTGTTPQTGLLKKSYNKLISILKNK